jgi:hypothetical protein
MQTNTLTCAFDMIRRLAIFQGLIRDEEVAGSNPATPTKVRPESANSAVS